MKNFRVAKKPVDAIMLTSRLAEDPEYLLRMQAQENVWQKRIEQYRLAASPVIDNLKTAGFSVESLDELRRSSVRYRAAIPILLKWLPLVTELGVKDSIVRALSVPWAKPIATLPLINEFKKQTDEQLSLKWTIGNALSVIADEDVADELFDLAQDKRHGKTREMIVVALANLSNARLIKVLINLLEDNEVCGHAVIAISKLKAHEALPHIYPLINHPQSWIRREALKTIKKLTRIKESGKSR